MQIVDIDEILESTEKLISKCCIIMACHVQYADVGGETVGEIRRKFQGMMNIPDSAVALIKGKHVNEDTVLLPGQTLQFVNESGEKGLGSLITPKDLAVKWQLSENEYQELFDLGLPSIRLETRLFHPEMAVDEWFKKMFEGEIPQPHHDPKPKVEPDVNGESVQRIENQLSELRLLLERSHRLMLVKEWYTVDEAAEKTGYTAWTIRQACNKGRIKGAKKNTRSSKWRIPHESVKQVENEGLTE